MDSYFALDQLLNTCRISFFIYHSCKNDSAALFWKFRGCQEHRYQRRFCIGSATAVEVAVLYPYWHFAGHCICVATQEDTGLARSLSSNNVANVVDINLFKSKLVDASILYHVGKCGL
jgi:hypothetical protein